MKTEQKDPNKSKSIGSIIGTGLGGALAIATGGVTAPLVPLFSALGGGMGTKFAKYGINVEDNETTVRKNGEYINFKGKTHEQGGINYNPSNKEFIYSNSIGYDRNNRLSFQDYKKSIADKAKKLNDRNGDDISKNTLSVLKKDNEIMISQLQKGLMYKYGGNYAKLGLDIDPLNTQLTSDVNLKIDSDRMSGFPTKVDVPGLNSTFLTSGNKDGKTVTTANNPVNLDKLQMASFVAKGLGVGANFIKGLQRPEIENEVLNSERNKINQLASSARINNDALQNSLNQSRNAAIATTSRRSQQVGSAINANIDANFMLKAGEIGMQKDQLNNQYKFQEAQMRGQLGSEAKGETARINDINAQNRAARSNLIGAGFTGLSQLGTIGNQYANNQSEIRLMTQVIGDRYRSFGLDDAFMKRIMDGTYSQQDLIKFKQVYTQAKQ